MNKIFKNSGLKIFDAEKIKSHGGSLRIYVKNIESKKWKDTIRYKKIATEELALGINKYLFYRKIKEDAVYIKNKFRKFLKNCKLKNQSVVGYGAAAKGITLINYSRIDKELMQYIIDKNPAKQNMFLPQSNIEIISAKILKKNKPDYVIILPWNLKNEIVKELSFIKSWGGKFVVFVPKFKII